MSFATRLPPVCGCRTHGMTSAGVKLIAVSSHDRPRGVLRAALRGAVLVGLFAVVVLLVDQLVPGAEKRLSDADPWWLVASLGLEIFACASYAVLFGAVFSRPPWRLTVRRWSQIGLAELGAFAILPTGLGGPAVRFWALRAEAMPWRVIIVRSVAHFGVFNLPYVAAAVVLGARCVAGRAPGPRAGAHGARAARPRDPCRSRSSASPRWRPGAAAATSAHGGPAPGPGSRRSRRASPTSAAVCVGRRRCSRPSAGGPATALHCGPPSMRSAEGRRSPS